jgi:methyltransferase-like protein
VSEDPDVGSGAAEQFEAPDGPRLSTNNPQLKAALVRLAGAWPRALPFEALFADARSLLGAAAPDLPDGGRGVLAESLLQCYLSNLVELHLHVPPFVLEVGERPVASPLARLQAEEGPRVTNRRHRNVPLSPLDRLVLQHLDGRHDRAALLDRLAGLAADGTLGIEQDGRTLKDPARAREVLGEALGPALGRLAGSALLIG